MIEINLKESLIEEINQLDRTGEFYDTISKWNFEAILNNTEENLFIKLIPDIEYFKYICKEKIKHINKEYLFKPLLTIADNVFEDENDFALLDDILIRLRGIPIGKYFYDGESWALNIGVEDTIEECIKLLSNRFTDEMYQILGEKFFKVFDKMGYAISIDKNYCNSNFHISEVNYKYSDTCCNRNFSRIQFESLVVRLDKIELIKKRYKEGIYVMDFHKKRYKLNKESEL